MEQKEKAQCVLGVIADVQYAPHLETGWDFHHIQQRHYQFSRESMCASLQDFAAHNVAAVIQLGDLLDGQCKKAPVEPKAILADLLNDYSRILGTTPVLHALGNHELYCFDNKQEAAEHFGVKAWNFTYQPVPGWKIIMCDSYAMSTLDAQVAEEAYAYLAKHNPNDLRKFGVDWLAGLAGPQQRYVPFNGALGEAQRRWLEQELDNCDDGTKVIIATHIPIMEGSCQDSCLLWDCEEIKALFLKSKAKVVAVFAGHDHDGGYKLDERSGVHHITMPSPMLCKNVGHTTAHALLHLHNDHIELVGSGSVSSRTLRF
eukprot:TRINITY_DN12025_c0_g1_i1.p1 TRINITY_DN12025_c0_g1~~TRINITY_DN12025_c0_g1_i1.p1  ORF type:complete len:316 (+),score=58.88 TRINITY_DN12025_c0_g1_i1:16-963(+)